MSYGPIGHTVTMMDGASANSSNYTSNALLVMDWENISVSIQTSGGAGSRYTIWATNNDGLQTPLVEANWSTITGATAQGLFVISPGMRWVRATRSAADSQGTVIFAGRT